uniref:Transposase n=1 Tax=Heterorhabditis bacteriophora TaxID=37862 RepID=A0A1I7WG67_HETBA
MSLLIKVNTLKPNSETYKIRPAWQDKTPTLNHAACTNWKELAYSLTHY